MTPAWHGGGNYSNYGAGKGTQLLLGPTAGGGGTSHRTTRHSAPSPGATTVHTISVLSLMMDLQAHWITSGVAEMLVVPIRDMALPARCGLLNVA